MRFLSFLILIAWNTLAFAQGFNVKEFKQNMSDGSAFRAPMDSLGHPCALIKVRSDNAYLHFKGGVVGRVENKMNEYWVFLTPNSSSLQIVHPNYMPLDIIFADYGINISPKATYILTLEETNFNKDKTGVNIVAKPEDAQLQINDVQIDNLSGNGLYQLYLPKGDYVCRMSKDGYRPIMRIVHAGDKPQDITMELESTMAELEVKCKTPIAEIYIDGELKGNGVWKGLVPAGEHKLEARQKNFNSYSQAINLVEQENSSLVIPELKRAMGQLRINTTPSNMPVFVDGKSVGLSPCEIEVEIGKHNIECKSYGIEPCRQLVEMGSGDRINDVKLIIQYGGEGLKDLYQKAYNGSLEDILVLACNACRDGNYQEADFWINRHPQGETIVKHWPKYGKQLDERFAFWSQCDWICAYSEIGNPDKALEIYSLWKEYPEKDLSNVQFLAELEMMYIGDSFLKKKEIDKALQCYEQAGEEGYEGMGDCYAAKGNKQLALNNYRKSLNRRGVSYEEKNRIEEKIKKVEQNADGSNRDNVGSKDMNVYDEVDQEPTFPGGKSALASWLASNFRYPVTAAEDGIQGKVVCSFVIERDGSISDVKVIKSVDPSLDKAAVRLIQKMPNWIPGKKNGSVVRVRCTCPVIYKL